MKIVPILLAVLCLAAGCTSNPNAFYSIHQVDVGSEKVFTRAAQSDVYSSTFEDDVLKVQFGSSSPGIGLVITNKSDISIFVNWDGTAYIDTEGVSHRVIHSGIKYIKKEEAQAETVIPRGSSIDDAILSADCIYYMPDFGWMDTMITIKMWGQRIKVLLPIRIGNDLREYLFDLEIMNEDVVLGKTDVKNGATS